MELYYSTQDCMWWCIVTGGKGGKLVCLAMNVEYISAGLLKIT